MPTTTVPKRKKKPGAVGGNSSLNGSGGNFTESAMDEFLSKQGLYRKPIAKDGSCLFRAVSEQVHNCQARHLDVRNQCIDFMRRNRAHFEEFVEGPFDHHLFKLQNPKEWAGQVEITALSQMYRKDFVVYQDINSPPTKVTDHGYKDKILLCYSNGNHYDIIYNNQYQEHAAMCQSVLFEVLYNRVFAELDKKDASKKGNKPKGSVSSSHSNQRNIIEWVNGSAMDGSDMMDNGGDDGGWTEVKSKARAKHERQSKSAEMEEEKEQDENKIKGNNDQKYLWELRRSVDPHLYRNIPLEVWEEDKHVLQQKDLAVAASLQFKNGERCSLKLGPPIVPVEKSYNAIIKEDYTGSGSIQVFVHELNKRHTVPVQSITTQQGSSYKDLSGYYQKDFTANGPASEEGAKDDNKFKKKRPQRNRRGPGKGGDEAGNATEEVLPRGRGKPRERYNRRRFPGGKDERNFRDAKDEEEARFMAEQIKLVELQEKDTTAFPALPVRAGHQGSPSAGPSVSPTTKTAETVEIVTSPVKEEKEKVQEKEKSPVTAQPNKSLQFWSKFNKSPKSASEETKTPTPNPTVPEQQEPDSCKLDDDSHIPEEDNPEEQPDMMEESKIENQDNIEVCVDNDPSQPSSIDDKEIKKPFPEPLQIKPISDDSKLHKNGPHVFEVKIPETVTSTLQPVKITHSNLKQAQEEPKVQPEEVAFTQDEQEEIAERNEETKEIENSDELEGMAGLAIKDKHDVPLPFQSDQEPFKMPSSSDHAVALPNEEPLSTYQETAFPQDEPTSKALKSRVGDSTTTPERKTVKFAEETKEIPDVPFGQSQKGILVVNGTNRPSQVGDQGYKPPNPDDYTLLTKESSKPDYMNPQDNLDKDPQTFTPVISSEGLQSSSPTAQQHSPLPPYMMPFLPPNVQMPARPSLDPSGADLPQDIPTLRHFFNLGYYHMMMANQLANQQVPLMYMYQGAIQDQIMPQAPQPVATMAQQQIYGGMAHQQLAFQHPGLQTYPPFHLPPHSTQDSTPQLDRAADRSSQQQHQPQIQPQQQIQLPHQQQSGHFQQPQNHMAMWRPGSGSSSNSSSSGGSSRHYNHKFQHHNLSSQNNRPNWSTGTGGNPRQPHSTNKQNRKPQGTKMRNEHYNQHFNNSPHSQGQNMAHSAMAASQNAYYSMPNEHQSKGHPATEYYPTNAVMYNYPSMQSGMPNIPHTTNTRVNYN